MNKQLQDRLDRLLPDGIPKYIRVYDNQGESVDRYTVVFSGNYSGRDGLCRYLAMSGAPFHPQGFCQHGESNQVIDQPRYGHLGRKIDFKTLPADCQLAVMQDYQYYWDLNQEKEL